MKKLLFFVLILSFLCNVGRAQTPQYSYVNNATGGNWIPFGVANGWDNYRSQFFYFPGDFPGLPTMPGFITKIYFKSYYATTAMTLNGFTVAIGNTTVTAPTNYVTGLTPCLSVGSFTTPAIAAGAWFEIALPTPVYVDPTQVLVIDVSQTGGTGGVPIYAGGTPVNATYTGNTHIYGLTSAASGTPRRYSYQFGFDMFAGYPCVDPPVSVVNAPTEVCPNRQFKVQPATYYANATYQWEYSDNGTTWQFHPAIVGLFGDITDALTAPRWYRCTITCTALGKSYRTPAWQVNIAPFYICYCLNGAGTATGLDIGNVTVVNNNTNKVVLNNGTATPPLSNTTANKTYTGFQYSVPPVVLYRDTTYKYFVSQINSTATFKPGKVAIYVDFNRDGIFDGTEKVMAKTITGATATPNTESAIFTTPSDAQIGLTGMRVIISDGATDSCGTFTGEGEVEDYLADIRYEPCKGPSTTGVVVSTDKSMCASYDYVVTDTTYEKKKSEIDRMWQVSADNIYWYNVPNGANKDTLMRIFTGQPLFYRMRLACLPSGDTTFTGPLKVDAKDGKKCYCYSQAIGGKPYDSSDVGGLTVASFTATSGGAHLLNPVAVKKRTDYTDDPSVNLWVDTTYQLTIYHTMRTAEHGDAKVTVFMDFNNNKEYDLPYERVYTGYTSIGNYTLVDKITIPDMVITEISTGMRVILNNNIAPNDPSDKGCGAYQSGETEDLMVTFHRKFPQSIGSTSAAFSQFGMFPNPTRGKFSLQFTTSTEMKEISVTIKNVTGQTIQQHMYKHDGGKFAKELDMTSQPRGVYFVELTGSNGEKATKKLVVE